MLLKIVHVVTVMCTLFLQSPSAVTVAEQNTKRSAYRAVRQLPQPPVWRDDGGRWREDGSRWREGGERWGENGVRWGDSGVRRGEDDARWPDKCLLKRAPCSQ
jgi:hypothetical protein